MPHLRHNLPGERGYVRERLKEIGLGTAVTSSTPSSTGDSGSQDQRSFREDAPIIFELLQARNHTRCTLLPPLRLTQEHDIPR